MSRAINELKSPRKPPCMDIVPYVPIAPTPHIERCPDCGMDKPGDTFVVAKGQRFRYFHCPDCAAKNTIDQIQGVKDRQVERDLKDEVILTSKVMASVKAEGLTDIFEMTEALMERWGGVTKFVDFFYDQVNAAADRKKGSQTVLNACFGVMKMVGAATQLQQASRAPDSMTDEVLAQEIAKAVEFARKADERKLEQTA